MLNKDSRPDLISQARQIARGGKPPGQAWGELKSWASDKGPLAMRSAAMEFITVYGRRPEALLMMPEVLRSSAGVLMPPRPIMDRNISLKPEFSLAKPALKMEPKVQEQNTVAPLQLRTSLPPPARPDVSVMQFDATKSPDSRVLGADKGHHIVRSLIHKMKSHAAETPRVYQGEPMAKTKKKMTKKKPAKKSGKKKSRKK